MHTASVPSTNLERETAARRAAMRRAVRGSEGVLNAARIYAREVAIRGDGTADIVRVRAFAERIGFDLSWGNWTGSLFRHKDWEFTGRWRPTEHDGSHARHVRVWRLRRDVEGGGVGGRH